MGLPITRALWRVGGRAWPRLVEEKKGVGLVLTDGVQVHWKAMD